MPKANLIPDKLRIPAAAYIRMSTDKQKENSAPRQKAQIEEYAQRHGYEIVEWYNDNGKTGTKSKNRPDYQRMLAAAPTGLFRAVLFTEISRFSREDPLDVFPQFKVFINAGVKLISCSKGEIRVDELGGLLTTVVESYGSREESRKLAERTTSGKQQRLRTNKRYQGMRIFGYDRELTDTAGNVTRIGFDKKFRKSPDCQVRLVPSANGAAVEAIQWVYELLANGGSIGEAVRELNRRGLRTSRGYEWNQAALSKLVKNPVYCGDSRVNYASKPTFFRVIPAEEGMVIMRDTHEPLVDRETFAAALSMLSSRVVPKKNRPLYLLSGILICGCCGQPMWGMVEQEKKGGFRSYQCCKGPWRVNCTSRPQVKAENLENAVAVTWIETILSDRHAARIEEAADEEAGNKKTTLVNGRLVAVRDKLQRAERNLAFAESESSFRVIEQAIAELKKEETDLLAQASHAARMLQASAETSITCFAS